MGVTFVEAVRTDAQGYDGEDEAEKEETKEEALALELALDCLELGALADEMVGSLVVLEAFLTREEVLGVALNF